MYIKLTLYVKIQFFKLSTFLYRFFLVFTYLFLTVSLIAATCSTKVYYIIPKCSIVILAVSMAVTLSSYHVRTWNTKHTWQYHKEKLNAYILLVPVNPNTSTFGLHGLIRCWGGCLLTLYLKRVQFIPINRAATSNMGSWSYAVLLVEDASPMCPHSFLRGLERGGRMVGVGFP